MAITDTNVEVRETETHGTSLFVTRDFKKDEVVFTVFGPIVTTPTIYTVPIDFGLYIDPERYTKYLNHSCEPSCGIKNRSQIVAFRDLKAGEEVNIDYAMIVSDYGSEMTEENRVCQCESLNCRGKLGAYNELSEELKEKYKGYISEYLLIE